MTGTLRERLERIRSALPGSGSSVTLTREDLDALLARTDFDAPKHRRHAKGWSKADG